MTLTNNGTDPLAISGIAASGDFAATSELQGYPSTLHGGVTAALLDAAMTNALFAAGVVAVTAELLNRLLVEAGFSVGEVVPARSSLEEAFRGIVGRDGP